MPLLTASEVREYLNISDATNEAELVTFASRAEAAVVARIGPITSTAVTARVKGYGSSLSPKVTPILSLTSVTPVGGSALNVSLLHAPAADDKRGANTIEYINGSWFGSRWYDVVYNAGRATVTEDLRTLILEVTRLLWETQRGVGAIRIGVPTDSLVTDTSTGAPGESYPQPIERMMAPYEQVWL